VKTAAQAVSYGGVAGTAFDPCYHQFCDNLRGDGQNVALFNALREDYVLTGNVNNVAFDVNADAVATAVLTFAFDTSTLPAPATLVPVPSRVAAHSDESTAAA
jgi:hypothetical protein